ncbi:hypothetical protein D3C80_1269470 [compost metagenome]
MQAFYMLDIYGTDHMYTCIQQVQYILPAFLVFTAFNIAVRQFIYNNDLRLQVNDRLHIHLFQLFAFVEQFASRNNGQSFQQCMGLFTAMCFYISNAHIYPIPQ